MDRAAGPRRRVLVRTEPDRGRQAAPVDERRRDPAHAGAATPAAHRLQRRALPDHRPLLEPFAQPALAAGLGRWWWAVLAVAILGPTLCLLPERLGRNADYFNVSSQAMVRMLGFAALFSLAAYLITPETAAGPNGDPLGFAFNLRYLAPALALALAVAPLAPALSSAPATNQSGGRAGRPSSRDRRPPALWPNSHAAGAVALGVAALVALGRPRSRVEPPPTRARRRRDRARPPRRRGRRLPAPAPLPPRPLRLPAERVLSGEGVGAVPDGPRCARWRRRHVRRLLLVSVLRTGSVEPGDLRRPARPKRVVHADIHLRSMAITGERRPPEIPNNNTRARPVEPEGAQPVTGNRLDRPDPAATAVFTERALGQPIVVFRISGPLDVARCPQG